jgi:hypothetical protein
VVLEGQVKGAVNVRSGPGTEFAIVAKYDPGAKLTLTGRTQAGDWYALTAEAWVSAGLVDLQQADLLPVITPAPTATPNAKATADAARAAALAAYRTRPPQGKGWCVKDASIQVCAGNFRYDTEIGYSTAGRGQKYVSCMITVFNNSNDTVSVNPFNVTLVDLDGASHSHDSAGYGWSPALEGVDVAPGDHAAGGIAFEVAQGTGPARIIYRSNFLADPLTIDLQREPDYP